MANSTILSIFGLILGTALASIEDINRDFFDIVLKRNLAVEEHQVMTQDGYILTLFRIPGKLFREVGKPLSPPGPPVLMMHGLIDSSDAWVVNDDLSPAFVLSHAGYDVWLSNSRGNKYSKRHVSLSSDSLEFWDFSWEEVGSFDLPALTDYILE
jgi:lysosomal acid lipase/cholesteryl ester hydrolase